MGKWLRASVVGVAVFTLFVSGCAGKANPVAGPAAAQRRVAETASRLDAIARQGKLHIGVEYSSAPFSAWKENSRSEYEGFAVDVGRRMTQIIFNGKVAAEFEPALSDRQSEMAQGMYHVLLEPAVTFDKEDKMHRSPPYFNNSMRFLVRKDGHAAHVTDLSGQQVTSLGGTPKHDYDTLKEFLAQQKQEPIALNYVGFEWGSDRVHALIEGKVAAVSAQTTDLASYVKADSHLTLLPERWEVQPCSAVVLKQNGELAAAVDKAIQQMIDSGEIADLAKKWGLDI